MPERRQQNRRFQNDVRREDVAQLIHLRDKYKTSKPEFWRIANETINELQRERMESERRRIERRSA